MQTIKAQLTQLFSQSLSTIDADVRVELKQSTRAAFGHYQCNNAMRLAQNASSENTPRAVAARIIQAVPENSLIEKMEIAGPGFINIWLNMPYLEAFLAKMWRSKKMCADYEPETIVIDFSAPNIAKEMHVGHLRSTIIGDALSRILEYTGNNVIRLNHLGDWGTSFGMLIAYLKYHVQGASTSDLAQLTKIYKAAKKLFDSDPAFKKQAQQAVVDLQSAEPEAIALWQLLCRVSAQAYHKIYDYLDVKLIDRGESYYQPLLAGLVADLESQGLVALSEGAKCVYVEGYKNREDDDLPFMIQKSDGGYNYSTTDLAALRQRVMVEKADRLIYVIDSGQALHLNMLFAVAKKAGYLPDRVRCEHIGFGMVLGSDGKKFKTRSGETVPLIDLLEASTQAAKAILQARDPLLNEKILSEYIKILGINAIKYADLSCHRMHDYVFSFERMLKFEGNTPTFLLYAYVRVLGIKRKIVAAVQSTQPIQSDLVDDVRHTFVLQHPSERALGLILSQFPEVIDQVVEDLYPHRLCDYLYHVAEGFNVFFRDCRVEGVDEQASRYLLCELTAKVLKTGMELLGLKMIDQM